ncbi:snRNA-activating protein complex subunit 2 [Hemicordylus capensis]|uniref:snRNA-activating protein complex subunit 2 n=1 Tax=Hemicordylus capensis TaxID=884348 RepID=UPI00230208F4|nr:snRNA-activating protein complex subunit 2 [Hemicordylus capensis]
MHRKGGDFTSSSSFFLFLVTMKPPSRQRSAPSRYRLDPTARAWTDAEKRCLLKALRAQSQGPLRPELLQKYVPSRDEAEILAFVQLLKERVAREAIRAQCLYRQKTWKKAPVPAPIEVWTDLAEKLTGCLENAVTDAFSQVLTIASAEPLGLLHSVPPKPVAVAIASNAEGKSQAMGKSSEAAAASSNAEKAAPAEQDGFHVDFEKIYKYLSAISRGSKAPQLPPGESAVLLDLLLSLPEELGFLDFKKLRSHMHKCYMDLSACHAGERSGKQAESSQSANSSGKLYDSPLQTANSHLPHQEGSSSTTTSDNTAQPSAFDWKTLDICPLNSFLLPLDILAQKKESSD